MIIDHPSLQVLLEDGEDGEDGQDAQDAEEVVMLQSYSQQSRRRTRCQGYERMRCGKCVVTIISARS